MIDVGGVGRDERMNGEEKVVARYTVTLEEARKGLDITVSGECPHCGKIFDKEEVHQSFGFFDCPDCGESLDSCEECWEVS